MLAEHDVIVRNIPGRPWLRASVGAWNDEHDLERLAADPRRMSAATTRPLSHDPGAGGARPTTRGGALTRARVPALRGTSRGARAGRRSQPAPALPERLRERLLLGRRAVDAALAAQLPLRLLRPRRTVTIDKPPLALWVQAASAKLFGFSPLSLLLPEAIAGVLAVALLYVLLAQAPRPARRARRLARARRVPLVRRRLARQRRRPAAAAADDAAPARRAARLRRAAAGARSSAARCSSGWRSTPRRSPPTWSSRGSRSPTSCARPGRCAGARRSCSARGS